MLNIKNEKDSEVIKQVIETGVSSDFWKLLVQVLEESIEHIQKKRDSEDIKDLPAEQYKTENELLKAKIKYLKNLINSPADLVSWIESPDSRTPEWDPYE